MWSRGSGGERDAIGKGRDQGRLVLDLNLELDLGLKFGAL